jgi:hypothetical protein
MSWAWISEAREVAPRRRRPFRTLVAPGDEFNRTDQDDSDCECSVIVTGHNRWTGIAWILPLVVLFFKLVVVYAAFAR